MEEKRMEKESFVSVFVCSKWFGWVVIRIMYCNFCYPAESPLFLLFFFLTRGICAF
ncbi:hypothetical protein JHK82_043906 [Glycine max]|nr:hypothetical protein JHK87_043703 [Glycine soja]KAG5106936.1 hypothetical protein JHK82_043906 [Glycine max]